jgi:Mannosyltransferase (PIG-V)
VASTWPPRGGLTITKQSQLKDIIWLFLATRVALLMITYIAYILLTAAKYSSTPVNVAALFTTWNNWDAADYLRIAQHGYEQRVDLAFFPLFPLLISTISHILGSWSYLLVGTLISNAALLGVLLLLYRLAADAFHETIAQRTLLYLCIFPTAFFFFAAYNESLYLLFTLGAFLALQRRRWWLAGLLGLLATATRSIGILLVIPYLYELWTEREQILVSWRHIFSATLPIVLIPLGMVFYGIYCWITVGDFLAFLHVQQHSGRYLAWPGQGIVQAFVALFVIPQPFGSSNEAHLLLDLCATLGFILLIILGWRKLRMSYNLWMVFTIVYILLYPALDKPDILLSNQRFVLELFPAFMTLAVLGIEKPNLHRALVLIFPTLLAVLSIAFLMNRWVV